MKKIIALVLAVLLVVSLAACGAQGSQDASSAATEGKAAVDMKVAMITDYGDITDQSFNQTTYEACKAYCEGAGLEFKYYKPASDSDEDRVAMIEKSIDEGHNVVVMPGYAFANAIKSTAENYEDVYFVALDVSAGDFGDDYTLPSNLYSAVYQEELAGYMAGYAAVKLGYTKLGFLGGMAVPAVIRYGYGYVQGVEAAAAADKVEGVEVKYAYGNQFFGDADITAAMNTWYNDGTEIVFACGGGIYTSAAEAAAKVDGKVIGVDVDQKGTIDGTYGEGMTVTSAMKGLAATVNAELAKIAAGQFEGGKIDNLGIISDDTEDNYVQLPFESTQWADGKFTQDDYKKLVADIHAGTITVDNSIEKKAADFGKTIKVDDLGNLK